MCFSRTFTTFPEELYFRKDFSSNCYFCKRFFSFCILYSLWVKNSKSSNFFNISSFIHPTIFNMVIFWKRMLHCTGMGTSISCDYSLVPNNFPPVYFFRKNFQPLSSYKDLLPAYKFFTFAYKLFNPLYHPRISPPADTPIPEKVLSINVYLNKRTSVFFETLNFFHIVQFFLAQNFYESFPHTNTKGENSISPSGVLVHLYFSHQFLLSTEEPYTLKSVHEPLYPWYQECHPLIGFLWVNWNNMFTVLVLYLSQFSTEGEWWTLTLDSIFATQR